MGVVWGSGLTPELTWRNISREPLLICTDKDYNPKVLMLELFNGVGLHILRVNQNEIGAHSESPTKRLTPAISGAHKTSRIGDPLDERPLHAVVMLPVIRTAPP